MRKRVIWQLVQATRRHQLARERAALWSGLRPTNENLTLTLMSCQRIIYTTFGNANSHLNSCFLLQTLNKNLNVLSS